MDNELAKSSAYKKNSDLEELLNKLNTSLELVNKTTPDVDVALPKVFILGVPRSGTTLLSQWLASTDIFCYPSNFTSRFYKAPFFGALIQEMLFNERFRYKDELSIHLSTGKFTSDTGKTKGALEPHEFWYFWRRFFKFSEVPVSNAVFEQSANFISFEQEINKFQSVFNKPFFIKALIINAYASSFAQAIKNSFFIYIKRDPLENMYSILQTRSRYFDDAQEWFSFKPQEYERLKNQDIYTQVAGQVYFLNAQIESQLREIPDSGKLSIDYEMLCSAPEAIYNELKRKLEGISSKPYTGVQSFSTKSNAIPGDIEKRLLKSYELVKSL